MPRSMSILVAGPAAALVAGCATGPPPLQSGKAVEVPSEWSTSADAASTKRPPTNWWRAFSDPRLDRLVLQALDRNHDLASAYARILQAGAQARIAGADRYPQLEAALEVGRNRQNLIGLPIPGGGSFITESYGLALNAAWEIDFWDRVGSRVRSAAKTLAATRADYAAAALSVAGQTAKLYFSVLHAQRQLELARRTLEIRRTTTARVRRRYEAGLVPPLDLRLALSAQAAADVLAASRARELDSVLRQLEIVVGTYPRGTLDTAASFPELAPLPEPGVPSMLLTRRPDLVAAELRIDAFGAQVDAARAALLPQVRLSASLGRRASTPADLFDPAFTVWSLAGSLLAPVFQGGRLRAQVELAQAQLAEVLETYRQTMLEAFREVETALASDVRFEQEVAAARDRLEQARAAARLAEERYGAGLVDLLSVFEAERQRLDAASQALTAQVQRLQARVDLYMALGGGLDAR